MKNNISNQSLQNITINYINSELETYIIGKVYFYCIIVIVAFGMIENLISILIFTRPNLNKKTNTVILYTSLCIFNLLTFIEKVFLGEYSFQLFHYIIWNNPTLFSIHFIIQTSLNEILSWIQVLICFDRFILVIYPMKAHIMRKKVSLKKNHIYNHNCNCNLSIKFLRLCYSQSLSLL